MISIGMSTTCVFPGSVDTNFRMARLAGFDGIEVMVTNDPVTQDPTALLELSERYGLPILSIHAPVLFLTTFVWGRDPQVKLERSAELAAAVGSPSVVVHPPFRWQSGYAENFERVVRDVQANTGVEICVENMFPWKVGGKNVKAYAPSPDPLDLDVQAMTLDFSHASLSGRDSLEYAMAMGERLRHIHLCDGTKSVDEGNMFDEHLVPGHGTEPVAETLSYLAENHWSGSVVAEVNLRKIRDERIKLAMLKETVAFAKHYVGQEHEEREPLTVGSVKARHQRRAARRNLKSRPDAE
ncbi:sugar phosphate isomerase/epimerase family protein [Lysinimonas soli]|uniref:Sugar phosphate isomerase/epimerase family protein n=1 Tax=Lysinimonas soli TaxID=1074233 RepID=A0ABW0NT75_9MICO